MKSLSDFLVILSSEVGDKSANVSFECISVFEASLHVGFVVVASETIDESSNEVSDFNSAECEISTICVTKLSWKRESNLCKCGSFNSSVVIVTSIIVSFQLASISLDCGHV